MALLWCGCWSQCSDAEDMSSWVVRVGRLKLPVNGSKL